MPMSSVAMIMLLVKAVFLAIPEHLRGLPEWALRGATEDMKAAYRQCPLMSSQVMLAITAVWNPYLCAVRFHEMWGQPFGAGHAVPNFYRMAEWACRVARRLLNSVSNKVMGGWVGGPPLRPPSELGSRVRGRLGLGGLLDDTDTLRDGPSRRR